MMSFSENFIINVIVARTYLNLDHARLKGLWQVEPDGQDDDGDEVGQKMAPRTRAGLDRVANT
jgi:hypothetical protein